MSQLTDMLMIGLVLVGGYYALQYMSQGSTTTTTTTVPSSTITDVPFEEVSTLWNTPELRAQACANWRTSDEDPRYPCTNECGKNGSGQKCNNCEAACNQANVYEKLYVEGEYDIPDTDRCATIWENSCTKSCGPNGNRSQCENCEDDCGKRWTHSYPGPKTTNARGLCESQGYIWNSASNCCPCRTCSGVPKCSGPVVYSKDRAKTPAPKPKPKPKPDRDRIGGTTAGAPKPITPATPKPKPKPVLKCPNGKVYTNCPKCKSLCNSPASFDACCKAASNYAYSYLAGSSSRYGPGYTGRDNFVDELIKYRTVPSPVDFPYESAKRPYFLGPISPERAALNKRFFANMAITIA